MSTTTVNVTGHPARFSPEIVDMIVDVINHEVTEFFDPPTLWDPFAGTGERLAEIAARCCPGGFAPLPYGGTEIEPEFIVDHKIWPGDACDESTYPPALTARGVLDGNGRFIIVTSPVYPNGIADAWKMADDSKRFTYQRTKNALVGEHTELHVNNQGRYGYRGTQRGGKSINRDHYWRIAKAAVANWSSADMVVLNVSDFKVAGGVIEPLVLDWRDLLRSHGWAIQIEHPVGTRRIGMGDNAEKRVENEVVVVAKR